MPSECLWHRYRPLLLLGANNGIQNLIVRGCSEENGQTELTSIFSEGVIGRGEGRARMTRGMTAMMPSQRAKVLSILQILLVIYLGLHALVNLSK